MAEFVKPKERSLEIKIAIVLTLIIGGVFAVAFAADILQIPTTGTIETVDVEAFWDAALTVPVTSRNWISPLPLGQTHVYPDLLYVVNIGNVPITLNFSTPDIPIYLTESWNYTNTVLNPLGVVAVESYLTVDVTAPPGSSFTYTLVIAGVET